MHSFYKFLIIITIASTTASHAQIKCWESSEGIRECGEKIPPEYSQKSHEVLSNHGFTIEKSERAKTKAEQLELKKIAAIKAQEMHAKEAQKMKDKTLLATYLTKEDIEKFANEKISDIRFITQSIQKRNANIRENLNQRIAQREQLLSLNKEPDPILLEDIKNLKARIMENQEFINAQIELQKAIKKEYAEKVERFIYLNSNKK